MRDSLIPKLTTIASLLSAPTRVDQEWWIQR